MLGVSMSSKVLIVTGDAGEGYEALYAYHRLLEARYEPVIAAPSARRLHLVIHDFEPGWDTYVERPGYGLDAQLTIDQVNPAEYDAILLLGGRAPEYLRNNQRLLEHVRAFAEAGKWLFAICHGIQILVAAGLVKGRRLTCYEHVRNEVETAGGTWLAQPAVRDGRLVTAQTWQSHPEFYREVFRCLAEDAARSAAQS
jgi:protease I